MSRVPVIIYLIVPMLLFFEMAVCQEWELQYQRAGSDWYRDVYMLSAQNICVVGEGGVIRTSHDGGHDWTVSETNVNSDLYHVDFVNAMLGWAVGESGIILHTIDGGLNWILQENLNLQNPLRSVDFVDEMHGWVCGENGCVYRTVNGGESWELQLQGSDYYDDLLGICFWDTLHGCAVGGYSQYMRPNAFFTMDGGETWDSALVESGNGWMADVAYVSSETLVGCGRSGNIWVTENGGVSWDSLDSPVQVNLRSIRFISPLEGWICGHNGTILHTENGINNWENQAPVTFSRLDGISNFNDHVCAVGQLGIIIKTQNGGSEWSVLNDGNQNRLRCVNFSNSVMGCAGGDRGFLLRTVDAGENWTAINSGTQEKIMAINFVSETVGWMLAEFGNVFKTMDGGQTWSPVASLPYFVSSLSSLTDQSAWICDLEGHIFHTADGGENWQAQSVPPVNYLNEIYFLNDFLGWSVGVSGTILKTDNGGETWDFSDSAPTDEDLNAVYFPTSGLGWAVGNSGTILSTHDSGETWDLESTPSTQDFHDVLFNDRHIGWIIGGSTILITMDGNHWEDDSGSPNVGLAGLGMGYPNLWAVGNNGTILHRTYTSDANPQPRAEIPNSISLSAYPNPFNPSTEIQFDLPTAMKVSLFVIDIQGRVVTELLDQSFTAGSHSIPLSMTNYSSGIYFARLETNSQTVAHKLVLIK